MVIISLVGFTRGFIWKKKKENLEKRQFEFGRHSYLIELKILRRNSDQDLNEIAKCELGTQKYQPENSIPDIH